MDDLGVPVFSEITISCIWIRCGLHMDSQISSGCSLWLMLLLGSSHPSHHIGVHLRQNLDLAGENKHTVDGGLHRKDG